MTAHTVPAQIAEFAARVRAQLSDLPAEELEELTDGLEADLSEAWAEDLARELPDPVAYADELRTAAGLPPRPSRSGRAATAFAALGDGLRSTRRDVATVLRRNPATRSSLDFLAALRPAWWVARAWVAAWLVAAFVGGEAGFAPSSVLLWLVLLGFVVVSVQWGRGDWGAERILPVVVVGNVVAALLLVPVVSMAASWERSTYDAAYVTSVEEPARGMTLDGTSITNIHPYDSEGRPLEGVQLFDQDGRPLQPALDWNRDECVDCDRGIDLDGRAWAPVTLETGEEVTNTFPLSFLRYVVDDMGTATLTAAEPAESDAPFLRVPALERPAGDPASDGRTGRPEGDRDTGAR